MSRIVKWWNRFFMKASAPHTYIEIPLVFFGLVLFLYLVYGSETRTMLPTSLLFFLVPCCGLYYALRMKAPGGRWYRNLAGEMLRIAVPVFLFNGLLLLYARVVLDIFPQGDRVLLMDVFFISLLAFPYVFFRVSVRVCVWWNGLRQRRLIWSLVTSHLIAVALLQALIVLPVVTLIVTQGGIGRPPFALPSSPFAQFFYHVQLALPMIGVSILVATVVLLVVLPVSIVVSYFFARRIRRRLDALLDAAHAAGDGDYSVRIAVSGADEIATLQTDFNTMSENLKINVGELQQERETVAALLKSRREMMVSVSHELRTPIAVLRAYLDSARRQSAGQGEVRFAENDIAIIEREAERLQSLIDDLFALSRAEVDQLALKCVPLDASAVIERVVGTVAPLAWGANRVEVLAQVADELPAVLADEARLEQALRNLTHNALRHTAPGGVVIVSADTEDGQLRIQVRDTGEGIAPEDLPHIWDRYFRGATNGGTGVGLTLVKSFVEAMGGQVAVESTLGEGSCFTLYLPLSTEPAAGSVPLKVPVA